VNKLIKHVQFLLSAMLGFYAFSASCNTNINPPQRVTLGIFHSPPYSYVDNTSRPSGLLIEVLDMMAEELNFSLQIIPCPFTRCLKMVKEGKVDVLGELIYTPERAKDFDFLRPAYMVLHSSFVFYALNNSNLTVQNYAELADKRIAVMRGAAYFSKFDNDPMLQKVEVDTERIVVEMLLKGRVDLAISVEVTADQRMGILNQPSGLLKKLEYRYTDEIMGHVVISKQFAATPLADKFQATYKKLAEQGKFDDILKSYHLPPIRLAAK